MTNNKVAAGDMLDQRIFSPTNPKTDNLKDPFKILQSDQKAA